MVVQLSSEGGFIRFLKALLLTLIWFFFVSLFVCICAFWTLICPLDQFEEIYRHIM